MGLIRLVLLLVLMVAVVGAVVFVERGHRRVTVQYAGAWSAGGCTAARARTFR